MPNEDPLPKRPDGRDPSPPDTFGDKPQATPPRLARFLIGASVLLAAILVIAYSLTSVDPPKRHYPKSASPTPYVAPNPCAHGTFDPNICAVRLVTNVARQAELTPYATVQIMCSEWWHKPRARKAMERQWVSEGAYPREARAVMKEILSYCPNMEAAA